VKLPQAVYKISC